MLNPNQELNCTYTPVYLGDCLCKLFTNTDKFGSVDPIDNITNIFSTKLMDFLPCVKAGFVLRNSLTMLLFIYFKNNDLQEENKQYSHFDDFCNKIFIEMDAEFYSDTNHSKMLMSEAIEREIIKVPLSTQDVIRLKRPEFNQDDTPMKIRDENIIYQKCFPNYYLQLLISHNCYSKNDLIRLNKIEILNALNDETMQEQMIQEHNIILDVLKKWKNNA